MLKHLLLAAALAVALPARAAGYIDSAEKEAQIRPGATTSKQLEELFGAPLRKLRFGPREVWEYEASDGSRRLVVSITLDAGGVVREVARMRIGGA